MDDPPLPKPGMKRSELYYLNEMVAYEVMGWREGENIDCTCECGTIKFGNYILPNGNEWPYRPLFNCRYEQLTYMEDHIKEQGYYPYYNSIVTRLGDNPTPTEKCICALEAARTWNRDPEFVKKYLFPLLPESKS